MKLEHAKNCALKNENFFCFKAVTSFVQKTAERALLPKKGGSATALEGVGGSTTFPYENPLLLPLLPPISRKKECVNWSLFFSKFEISGKGWKTPVAVVAVVAGKFLHARAEARR